MRFEDVNFDEKLPDGRDRYRLLSSGAVLDNAAGHIVARRITSEQGREMAARRWDKYREATASRILKEARSIDPDVKTEHDAWALLLSRTFQQALDSEKPRAEAVEVIGKALGAMPFAHDVKLLEGDEKPTDFIPLLRELAVFAAQMRDRETVEGTVTDVE